MVRNLKKVTIYISLLILIILVSGCGDSKEAEIKQNFNKMLRVYPTKNLEDFTIKKVFEMENLIKTIKELGLLDLK